MLYPTVYKNTTRGTIFTSYTHIYDHIAFANFYGLMVYFTTFCFSICNNITYIVKIGGGGLCGEKHTHLLIP